MDRISGFYIFGGTLIGALFGFIWNSGGDLLTGIAIGAIAGTFIGWFIAAALFEQRKNQK